MVTPVPARPHLHTSLVLGHEPSGELQFFHLKHPDSSHEGSASPLPGYVLFLKQLLLNLYLEVSGTGSAGTAARPAKLHRSRLATAKSHPMDASARVRSSSAAKALLLLPASFCRELKSPFHTHRDAVPGNSFCSQWLWLMGTQQPLAAGTQCPWDAPALPGKRSC